MQMLIYIGTGFIAVAIVTVPAAAFAAVTWAARKARSPRPAPAPSCPCLFVMHGADMALAAVSPDCGRHEYRPGGTP